MASNQGISYNLEPVYPTGTGSNKKLYFSSLNATDANREHVAEVAVFNLPIRCTNGGSGGIFRVQGADNEETNRLECVFHTMTVSQMQTVQKQERAQTIVHNFCNLASDPVEARRRAGNPTLEIDLSGEVEEGLTALAASHREQKKNPNVEKCRNIFEDNELMQEIHDCMDTALPNSEAFRALLLQKRALAASRLDFIFVFRPSPAVLLSDVPPPGSTTSLLIVAQLIVTSSLLAKSPSMDNGVAFMLSANRKKQRKEQEAREGKQKGQFKAVSTAQICSAESKKLQCQKAVDPVEDIYRRVYSKVANNLYSQHTARLVSVHTRNYFKVRQGQNRMRDHLQLVEMGKQAKIRYPVMTRDKDGKLVEKQDSRGVTVFKPQPLDLRFSSHFDPAIPIADGVHEVHEELRKLENYVSDEHLDALMLKDERDPTKGPGQFREKLARLQKLQLAKVKPIKDNIAVCSKYLQGAKSQNDRVTVQKLKDSIAVLQHKLFCVNDTYNYFYNSVFKNNELWRYGMCFSARRFMDGLLEPGAAVFRLKLEQNHFQHIDPDGLLFTALSPDPVFKFDQYQQKRRENGIKYNSTYDPLINPGPSTLHGDCILNEQMQTLGAEHLPTQHKTTDELNTHKDTNLLKTTFTDFCESTAAKVAQLRQQQFSERVEWQEHVIFDNIGTWIQNFWHGILTNKDTCVRMRAVKTQCEMLGVVGIVPKVRECVEEVLQRPNLHNYSDLGGIPPTVSERANAVPLKELFNKTDFGDLGDICGGLSEVQRVNRLNQRNYLQSKEDIHRVENTLGKKNKQRQTGYIRRLEQQVSLYDCGVDEGQCYFQLVVWLVSKGARLLSAQRLAAWLIKGALMSFDLQYDKRQPNHFMVRGDVATSKSFIMETMIDLLGDVYAASQSGSSEHGDKCFSPDQSQHCGLDMFDEVPTPMRASLPGSKGGSAAMVSEKGERQKSEWSRGIQQYSQATTIQDADGHNHIGLNTQTRWKRASTIINMNDEEKYIGSGHRNRCLEWESTPMKTTITPAAIVADTPASNSNTALYQKARIDDARLLIWQVAFLNFIISTLTQAKVFTGIDNQSMSFVQQRRDQVLEAHGEEAFGYRKQNKVSQLSETNCLVRMAHNVFRDPYGPASITYLQMIGNEKFEAADLVNSTVGLDILSMAYTDFQDDISATMHALKDSKIEDEHIVREAAVLTFLQNSGAARDMASMFGPRNDYVEGTPFVADLHYVKVTVNCNSREPKHALMAIAKRIAPKITRNKEKYTEEYICQTLLNILNDVTVVKYPAMLDASLPGVDCFGCGQTVMSLQHTEAEMRKHAKSALPEVRELDQSGLLQNQLTAEKLNSMGHKWLESGFNVLYGKAGAEYFPSAFMNGADAHFNQSLITANTDGKGDGYVSNNIFDLSMAADKKYVKINTYWLLKGMVRMQSNEHNKNLPDELMKGMAHSAVVKGFYIHGGMGMTDMNPEAPHAFKCKYVEPQRPDEVVAVQNTNYASEANNSQVKANGVLPREMKSHAKTLNPKYPESLQHCRRHNESMATAYPEHILSERLLLLADSHGIQIAGPYFIRRAEQEFIKRCMDLSNYPEYSMNRIEKKLNPLTGKEEIMLVKQMTKSEFEQIFYYMFTHTPEDGYLCHFARDYLWPQDIEPEADEHGHFHPITKGRYYRNGFVEDMKAEARILSITSKCWHQYTGPGEGMFTFQVIEKASRTHIEDEIQFMKDKFNNGGYHPTEKQPVGWDAASFQKNYDVMEIHNLPSNSNCKTQRDGKPLYNNEQIRCAFHIQYWVKELKNTKNKEAVLAQNLNDEIGVDLTKYGKTYYQSRMRNDDNREFECHHTGYIPELERLARAYHSVRKEKWGYIPNVFNAYRQTTDTGYTGNKIQLAPEHKGSEEEEKFWTHFYNLADEERARLRNEELMANNNQAPNQHAAAPPENMAADDIDDDLHQPDSPAFMAVDEEDQLGMNQIQLPNAAVNFQIPVDRNDGNLTPLGTPVH